MQSQTQVNEKVKDLHDSDITFIEASVTEHGKPFYILIALHPEKEPIGFLQFYKEEGKCLIKRIEGTQQVKTLLEARLLEAVNAEMIFHEL